MVHDRNTCDQKGLGRGAGRRGFSTRPACDRMKKIHVYTPLPTFIGCPLCPRPCREKALMTLLPPTGVPSSERRWCSSTGAAQLSKRLEARLPLPGPRAWPPQSSDRCLVVHPNPTKTLTPRRWRVPEGLNSPSHRLWCCLGSVHLAEGHRCQQLESQHGSTRNEQRLSHAPHPHPKPLATQSYQPFLIAISSSALGTEKDLDKVVTCMLNL